MLASRGEVDRRSEKRKTFFIAPGTLDLMSASIRKTTVGSVNPLKRVDVIDQLDEIWRSRSIHLIPRDDIALLPIAYPPEDDV